MIIDLFTLLIIICAVMKGYGKGFIVAIASFFALYIGLAVALKFSVKVSHWFQSHGHNGNWMPFLSFMLVIIAVIILVRLGATLLQKAMELFMLGWLNRIAGMLVYIIIFLSIYSTILFYATKMDILTPEITKESKTYFLIEPLGPGIIAAMGKIIPFFEGVFEELKQYFGK